MDKKRLSLIGVTLLIAATLVAMLAISNHNTQIGVASIRSREAFNTREDSYAWNGADITLYSDDHATPKITLKGDSGNLGVVGTLEVTGTATLNGAQTLTGLASVGSLNATTAITAGTSLAVNGASTLTGTVTTIGAATVGGKLIANTVQATDNITALGGIDVAGALEVTGTSTLRGAVTMYEPFLDSGQSVRINDNVLVTGTMAVSGILSPDTINVTDQMTVGAGIDIVGALEVTGTSTLRGIAYINGTIEDAAQSVRINDNVVITGTASVSGMLSPDTINVTDQMTVGAGVDIVGALEVTGTTTLRGAIDFYSPFLDSSGSLRLNDNVLVTGTLNVSGVSTLAGGYTWTGLGAAGNGLQVAGNLTSTNATDILRYGAAVISSTLDANTLNTTDAVTIGATLDVAGTAHVIGAVDVTGTLTAKGYFQANTINTTDQITVGAGADIVGALEVTGTSTLRSLVSANNGVSTDRITTTAGITVGTYVGALSYYGAISSTVGITNAEVVQVTGKMIMVLTVSDGDAVGSIAGTLNDVTSLSDGAYAGQLLILVNLDADADTVVVKNGANTALGKDRTLDTNDTLTLYWDANNSVWRIIDCFDASA